MFFQVGDKVKHNFSGQIGYIRSIDLEADRYKYYVEWEGANKDRSDWYDVAVLVRIPKEPGAMTLADIGF